ncbi:MAG: MOSC domain-containing protein [Sulfurospirillum sp.]|nr:MOSC domain-containing protein [Sulfurospirillum sp.]
MSKKPLGSVISLFISKKEPNTRELRDTLTFALDGVCEDRFRGKDIERSVLLVSQKSYDLAKENGITLLDGDLGENILVDFDLYVLPHQSILHIGDTILEICKKSTMCSSLSKINNKLPKLLKDKRGIFAKVIKQGSIKQGDAIY